MDKMILGLKVKTLREHRNLTQSKLAEMISITDAALSNIETGKSYPRITTLIAISDVLNVSIPFLIDENEDAAKICLNEIEKCMFIFDKSIAIHVMEYIEMCIDLDEELKMLKKRKKLAFSWYKDKKSV